MHNVDLLDWQFVSRTERHFLFPSRSSLVVGGVKGMGTQNREGIEIEIIFSVARAYAKEGGKRIP